MPYHETDRQKVMALLRGLLPLFLACAGISCFNLEQPPASLPDYDNRNGFILDYKPGDRFETLKPMFLTRPSRQELYLAKPGIGAPSIEQYAERPDDEYVVKLMPAGTPLELVAIKDGKIQASVPYLLLEGYDRWVGVTLGEYADVEGRCHLRYNREFFRKIGESTNAPPPAATGK